MNTTLHQYMRASATAVAFSAMLSLTPVTEAVAEEMNLTIASSHSPKLPFVGQMSEYFTPTVDKEIQAAGLDLKLNWSPSYSGVLYSFQYTLESVEDNVTDFGWVGTIWESSKMPLQQISFMTPFVVDDVRQVIDVMNQLHDEIPEVGSEWDKHNQVFLGATGIGTYHIYTTFPFTSLKDLEGKKINGAGLVGSWLKGTGAVPVDGGIPVFYENVKNNIVDGVLLTAQTAYSIKLHEVAPYVTKIRIGAQYVGGLSVNKDVWEQFTPEAQKIMKEAARGYSKRVGEITVASDEAALKKMETEGATVTTLPDAARNEWMASLPNLPEEWIEGAKAHGSDAAAKKMLAAYLEKLQALGVKPDRAWTN